MKRFQFSGEIPASKSLMNRALLVQSFFPALKIMGASTADDVRHMKLAIVAMIRKEEINCGEAGTVLRFMAPRISREKGAHYLKASPRLLSRPQEELALILTQLGTKVDFLEGAILITSEGWKKPLSAIRIPRDRSSQFASGLLLSAWNLPFTLEFDMSGHVVSEGYWQMSLAVAQQLGMELKIDQKKIIVPAQQKVTAGSFAVEPDYSSMFAVVAAALVGGEVRIRNVGESSLQPDFIFLDFLKKMQAPIKKQVGELIASGPVPLKGIDVSLRSCPDLFPVLAVLCSFANGVSKLREAPQLAHKESNRLKKTHELLRLAGVKCELNSEGISIEGKGSEFVPDAFTFDPDQDHRMAMAASLYMLRQQEIHLLDSAVVKKSYPEYWSVIGLAACKSS